MQLPRLPLELYARGTLCPDPQAVAETGPRGARIVLADAAAREAGVRRGMSVTAAHALCRQLILYPRAPEREAAALEGVAAWALRFTSFVSVASPVTLLLEVAGSLRLFGGLDVIVVQLRNGMEELGYHSRLAVAPTPRAALWLARARDGAVVQQRARLVDVLSPLPLQALNPDGKKLQALRGMGLRCVGDLLRLPRDGLARRLGKELVHELDRALGRAPDPRAAFVPPHVFHRSLSLPAEIDNVEALLFPIQRLVSELAGLLHGIGGGVQELKMDLQHRGEQRTTVLLELAGPTRDAAHLMSVLRERIHRLSLPAPVLEIFLVADAILPLGAAPLDLFAQAGEGPEDRAHLLERLRARLGDEAVSGLRLVVEHRPERAWRFERPGAAAGELHFGHRPLWLLPEPRPLTSREGRPCFHGVLELEGDEERIESGWWDGEDIARDYFIARTGRGERLWVFRALREGGERPCWYLHGIFA